MTVVYAAEQAPVPPVEVTGGVVGAVEEVRALVVAPDEKRPFRRLQLVAFDDRHLVQGRHVALVVHHQHYRDPGGGVVAGDHLPRQFTQPGDMPLTRVPPLL